MNLLITGATGFLGGAVLAKVLLDDKPVSLLLLVRSDNSQNALARIKKNLVNFGCSEKTLEKLTSDNILIGDLSDPDGFIHDERLNNITHVINSAAIASFGENPLIWKVNVEGTLKFAAHMSKHAKLQRFVHVGTAMSCVPEADSVVTESLTLKDENEHLVQYTYSKSVIENRMLTECPDLPLVIARPSIIVGHSEQGCTPSTSIFWVFRMALMLGKFMCSMDDKIDVIPVDYCADALLLLLQKENMDEKIFHISAGEAGSVTFGEIDSAIAQATETKPVNLSYEQVEYIELVKSRKSFKGIFGQCNERLMLRAMRLYGEFSILNVRFSNEKLLQLGISAPPRFTDYVAKCVATTANQSIPEQMVVDFK
ncbi:SDR family oxidoreductase [Hafnia alvei]|uniref:Male sterility protein n=1 Tax=Hafnia alvei TaxID=569 RepID=A0A1C6YWF5_HAFAL|nr:SDR family oxidoreductase [Hafnia alvei]NLS56053.1 NAD-dependent epimerase/dehydratase family protein [Hafnia alvei]SCM51170.1 Male sterility protein [Hafnia alvei]